MNDNNTISFFTNQNDFDGKFRGLTDVLYYNDPSLNKFQNFNTVGGNSSNQYNFDYKLDFNKDGHNLELEVDYNEFKDDEVADFRVTGNTLFPNYIDFVNTKREQTIANLDYVNPLDSISKLELGVEARIFETNVDYSSTGLSFNESGNLLPTPDKGFIYEMDIYSALCHFLVRIMINGHTK